MTNIFAQNSKTIQFTVAMHKVTNFDSFVVKMHLDHTTFALMQLAIYLLLVKILCVILISSDGKRHKQILELERRKSIYFNERQSRLYACCDDGSTIISFIIPQNLF